MKFAEHLGAHITPEWRKQCKFHNLWFHEFTNRRKFWWIFIFRYTVWRNESQIGNVYSRGSIARISGTRSFDQVFRKIRWSILHILWKRWVIIRSQLLFRSEFWSEVFKNSEAISFLRSEKYHSCISRNLMKHSSHFVKKTSHNFNSVVFPFRILNP